MSNFQTVLITGASGLLGANLAHNYASNSNCVGWYRSNQVTVPGVTTQQVELTDPEAVARSIDEIKPNLIVHCAAATDVEWCEQNPELAKAINQDATELLANKSAEIGAKFVFTSTDSVFDGKSGRYSENSTPTPLNSYAKGKVATESIVAEANPDALIIRSYFYGYSPSGQRSLLEWVLVRAQSGEEVPGFSDSFFSPISVHDFAGALDVALNNNSSGLLHLGSSDRISKYEFARLVMETFGCDLSLLRSITVDEAGLRADRPRDTSLDISLLESIWNKRIPSVADGIQRIAASPNVFS